MLKKWFTRDGEKTVGEQDTSSVDAMWANAAILHEADVEAEDELHDAVMCSTTDDKETLEAADIGEQLSDEQKEQVKKVLREFEEVFSGKPGLTTLAEHKIVLTSSDPVRLKPYPVPYNMREAVDKEVQEMLKFGVIEPSESPYSSPLLLVRKKDGTNRPVIDFRQLNKITVFDAEPMPSAEETYSKLASAKFLTKLDFTKGYWQIPMRKEDKAKTAFTCGSGSFQFTRMPFGLVNSGAAYNRMMRRLLEGMKNVDSFVDDVLVYTDTWEDHLQTLRELLTRIRTAHLTVKLSKCVFGVQSVDFVGHHVGKAALTALPDKVEKIVKAVRPQTKTQVRAFLGLAGYYRRFVPNYAAISVPLTDATKKGAPIQVEWGEAQQRAFEELKSCLSRAPILKLPDWREPFVVRTDASDTGLGAVLLQEHDGILCPIMYASRKLLPRERNYSTIEKECLGVVWAIHKFEVYLYGREFVLQTDHQPLVYMDRSRLTNARVMRWALSLQPYRYRLEAIPGKENVGADYLSRSA